MFDEVWKVRTNRAPHTLCDTDPLPKFKHMPFCGNTRRLSKDEQMELFQFPIKRPAAHGTTYAERQKTIQKDQLDDLLPEDEELDPMLSRRNVRRNDIWDIQARGKNVDALLAEISELDAVDETAMAASNLAQVAVQNLPLMVLEGQLYCQIGSVWRPMSKREFVLAAEEDSRLQAALRGFNGRKLSDVYERVLLQRSIQRDAKEVEMPPSLIPCRDGVFDLDTMRSRHVRPDDYFFSCCNIGVDEIGMGSGERFEDFLALVAEENPVIRQQILEMIGIVISGYRPKKFFLLLGPRDTGKSQIMNLLRSLIGAQHTMSISEPNQLAGDFISGSLIGKRLCYCPDAARVNLSQKSAAMLKQLTGGDLMQANVKYRQSFTFINEATIVFVSNFPLQLPRDSALEDRLVTIPFTMSIPRERQVPNFSRILYKERGYIVGAAIEALRNLADRGFQFTGSDSTTYVPANTVGGSALDQITQFVEERCQLDPDGKEYTDTLYQVFCEFSQGNGGILLSREVFSRSLSAAFRGLEPFRTAHQRGYRGIRLIR